MENNIKQLRKAHQMTQETLSQIVRVSRQSIVAIESGKHQPSLELAYNIAKVFDRTIEEVFFESKR